MSNTDHRVSIVICTKDRPDELRNCINCVLKQSYPLAEIIIIDASDDDKSNLICKQLSSASTVAIKHLRSRPHHAHQKNIGINESAGDIVLLLDDDVEIQEDFTSKIVEVFDNDRFRNIGGVTGNDLAVIRPRLISIQKIIRKIFFLNDYGNGKFKLSGLHTAPLGLKGVRKTDYLPGAYTAYYKRVLIDIGLLDDTGLKGGSTPFEDSDLSYRVSRKYQNYYTEFAKCVHKHSEKSRFPIRTYNNMIIETYPYYFAKNIPQNILTKCAYKMAMYGLRNNFYYMLDQDIILFFLRKIFGEKLTGWLLKIKRGIPGARGGAC